MAPAVERVSFGEAVRLSSESIQDPAAEGLTRMVALEHLEPEVPYLRQWSEISGESSFTRRFRAGQVLFAKRRVYQRKAALVAFDGICSGDLLVLEAKEQRLLPALLPFLVHSEALMRHAERTSAGSLSPRTKWKDLAKFEFQLPAIDDQPRIVDLLQAAAAETKAVEDALHASRVASRAMSSEHFQGQLDEGKCVPLKQVLAQSQYGLSQKSNRDGGVPILGMGQMQEGRMSVDGAGYVDVSPEQLEAYRLHPGDILFNRTNSIDHVGRVAYNELDQDVVFASYLIRLKADREMVEPEYLFAYLASRPGQRHIRRFITRGVSQANVNATNLKSIATPVPSPQAQREFVSRAGALDALIGALAERLRSSRALTSMLIDREFVGAVDVH
jgi:type I restriction enzyme, S subunit